MLCLFVGMCFLTQWKTNVLFPTFWLTNLFLHKPLRFVTSYLPFPIISVRKGNAHVLYTIFHHVYNSSTTFYRMLFPISLCFFNLISLSALLSSYHWLLTKWLLYPATAAYKGLSYFLLPAHKLTNVHQISEE